MRFSEIQKKEVIDSLRGSFLGYIGDATIDKTSGKVVSFHVSGGEKGAFFDVKDKDVIKVKLEDISIIGKDIVLVERKRGKI